jgi:hypothetical protein
MEGRYMDTHLIEHKFNALSDDLKQEVLDFIDFLITKKKHKKSSKKFNFSLHSIGVILFRHKQEFLFNSFVADVLPKIEIISLSRESYKNL